MILWLIVGYCVAVIFPVPIVSQAILNGWSAIGSFVKSKMSSTTTTPPAA
jgi:hypothetical protein